LASLAKVVDTVRDRLLVEFNAGDLYACYEAFNLDTWQREFEDGGTLDTAFSRVNWCASRLCEALGQHHNREEWISTGQKALQKKRQMVLAIRRRLCFDAEPDIDVIALIGSKIDNRVVWRTLLDGGELTDSQSAIARQYLSTLDGTGEIERGLARDKAVMAAHQGPHNRGDEEAELYSCLAELLMDGPRNEAELFKKGHDEVLLLTDFTRRCAARWVDFHGRRFGCYRSRKDTGRRLAKSRLPGSDRGVQACARGAYTALAEMGEADRKRELRDMPNRPTMIAGSEKRRELLEKVVDERAKLDQQTASKEQQKFVGHSARKRQEKKKSLRPWSGLGTPTMRLGGAMAVRAASRAACSLALAGQRRQTSSRIPKPLMNVGPLMMCHSRGRGASNVP
jgi:hypothetical protein